VIPEAAVSPVKAPGVLLIIAALFALVVGCTSDAEPELPSSTDTTAIADRVTGPDGQTFLRDITAASWKDDGHRAAELFAWVPRDAQSTDRTAATRAGETAHAVASFLADNRESFASAPANPALWQAFAQSLAPYLGAMVGDESGVAGFEPLDGTGSQMRHTTSMFAAMAKNVDANRIFTEAASARAHTYEAAFAKAALAEPFLADRDAARTDFLQAARLRSLVATASKLVDPQSERFTVGRAQTEVAYQVVSLTARPDDPHIDEKFFSGGRLLSPSEIADEDWSIYDSQLTVYLATSPRINDAIYQFGDAYNVIATGQ
jgi:hypothetical protein